MTASDITAMVMAGAAIFTAIFTAISTRRVSRRAQSMETVASWAGLNDALNEDNRRLRQLVEHYEVKLRDTEQKLHALMLRLHDVEEHLARIKDGVKTDDAGLP